VPKILIADDNSNIQKMATLALKDQGYEVVGVSNGEAAVRRLPEVNPDVVLADVFMPVRNGYEVCDFVKKDARFAHVPVVLLVGAFDPIDEHEVKRVGADEILQKPFVPPDPLIQLVKLMVEKSVAARAAAMPGPKIDVERTMKLTREEMGMAEPPAAPPEPVPEMPGFETHEPRIEIKEGEQPLAFGEMLGTTPEEEPKPKVVEPEKFVASSIASLEAPAVEEAAEPAAPETPQWGGIESPPREPAPEEPPIKVEFGEPEPMELVTDEATAAAGPSLEIAPPPDLATSATEFMEAAKEAEPPALLAETEEAWTAAPAAAPPKDASLEETQEVPAAMPAPPPPMEVPKPTPPPPAKMAPPPMEMPVVMAPAVVQTPAVPQPLDPAVVDAVVEKVVARLQPQLMEQISREILRPLVEAMLRKDQEE